MINSKDIIRLKVPFPTIDSGLARKRHMYVVENERYSLFAVQTAKPHLVRQRILNNYIDLLPGEGSPVQRPSYVGMDVRFILEGVLFADAIKANSCISDALYSKILEKAPYVTQSHALNRFDIVDLNDYVLLS